MQSAGKDQISGRDVLVSMFRETDSHAVFLLERQGISRLDVVSYISHGVSKIGAARTAATPDEGDEDGDGRRARRSRARKALESFAVNLNQRAAEGDIDPLIGREDEVERTIHVLCRRRKNNPLYVGDAGVGKTAIAEGLALKIHRGEVPEVLNTTAHPVAELVGADRQLADCVGQLSGAADSGVRPFERHVQRQQVGVLGGCLDCRQQLIQVVGMVGVVTDASDAEHIPWPPAGNWRPLLSVNADTSGWDIDGG